MSMDMITRILGRVAPEPHGPTVYASQGGDRYHETPECRALVSAQLLWDWDAPDGGPTVAPMNGGYAALSTTALDALGAGKTPCAVCFPWSAAALARSSCEEDFGHEPVDEYAEPGLSRIVCARCMHWTRWADVGLSAGTRVAWPCTTAVVLGLVDREQR